MPPTPSAPRATASPDLKDLLAKATPLRSGDVLSLASPEQPEQRVAAQYALVGLPLATFLNEAVIPYEDDGSRLILDSHDAMGLRAGRAPDGR